VPVSKAAADDEALVSRPESPGRSGSKLLRAVPARLQPATVRLP